MPGLEAVARVSEALSLDPAIPDMGFVRVHSQAILVHKGLDQRKGCLRFLQAVAQDDKVVGVSNHRQALRGHQFVERVQIEICPSSGLMTAPCGVPPAGLDLPHPATMS